MKVKVTEYKNVLVIVTLKPEKDDDFCPVTEPGRVGSVLINTGKHLGMSEEALAFMKKLRVSHDDMGEVDAWITDDGRSCFAWLGALSRFVGPDADLSNTGFQGIGFIEILNETNEKAKEAIDAHIMEEIIEKEKT